jgi:hypothetical protein
MSLVKKPTMTEEKTAANWRNGSLSQGPVTAQGKQRIARAQVGHRLDADTQEMVLLSLGEDPARFSELLDGLRREFMPEGVLQEQLVNRLARVLWQMERADRAQEGQALRRAQTADGGRDNRLHARMMRLKMTVETLRSLARSVAEWHYVTTREDLEVMKKVHQDGVTSEMGEIALALFYQLQEPNADENGLSEEERYRGAVNSFRSIFGLENIQSPVQMLTPSGERVVIRPEGYIDPNAPAEGEEDENSEKDDRYPKITEEDWIARERARKLLKNILSRQAEACENQRMAILRESLSGPSPYEVAAETAGNLAEALQMRRVQDGNAREVRRLTNLLLKIKRQQRRGQGPNASDTALGTHDVSESKGG